MTALAEKLRDAGADTIGARFTDVCTRAARLHPDNIDAAWRAVGSEFGHAFIRQIIADMNHPCKPDGETGRLSTEAIEWKPSEITARPMVSFNRPPVVKPYQPRVLAPERVERRKVLQEIVRSKFKNSAGVAWSDVSWHELSALDRDGNEAKALLMAAPGHVPNDGRTVGQVLGVAMVDKIIQEARGD